MTSKTQDIVDTATTAGNFKTFLTALSSAGLANTLKGTGPYTVFAPTDAAFSKAPKSEIESLLKDKAKLNTVLLYHVVPGRLLAADLIKLGNGAKLKTVGGMELTIRIQGNKVMVGGADVIKGDVSATNGVIHLIDSVLMPSATRTEG